MKKAAIEIDELVKLILVVAALALVIVGIFLLRGNLSSIIDSIKNSLRF